ncbi:hypothetical protein [Pseudomonas baetica]|uniref:hypothetical protein n=1 Tax=Pseudomonas baetica TaxID=674054 RepID=UPI0011B249C4|nr:hypothetical protein [Pseudomonas baetica]
MGAKLPSDHGNLQPQGHPHQNLARFAIALAVGFILWALRARRIPGGDQSSALNAPLNQGLLKAEASLIASAVISPPELLSSSGILVVTQGFLFGWHTCTSYSCYARTQNF